MKKSLSAIIFAILLTSVFVFSSFPMLSAANSNQTTSTNTSAPSDNWNNNVDKVTSNDDGCYHIDSASKLAYISKDIASGSWTFRNAEIVLDNDIDLSAYYWTPIGINNRIIFNGTFDGNWHKITGLNVKDAAYAGLFGYVGMGATIENLIVENAKVSGKTYAGTIAGYSNYYSFGSATFSNLIVINPKVESTNTSSSYAGGIVGYKEGGSIKNCYVQKNDSNEGAKITSGGGSAGGIVGLLGDKGYPNITLCYNNAEILSESSVASTISCSGGIVGCSKNSSAKIDQCYNTGKITSTSTKQNSYSGGIAGYLLGGTISNCYNEGEINSEVQGYDTYFNYDLDMYEEDLRSLDTNNPYTLKQYKVHNDILAYDNKYYDYDINLYCSPDNYGIQYNTLELKYSDTSISMRPQALEYANYMCSTSLAPTNGLFMCKDIYNPKGYRIIENVSRTTYNTIVTLNEAQIFMPITTSTFIYDEDYNEHYTNVYLGDTGSYIGTNRYCGHTGGIAGSINGSTIKFCYNRGTIDPNGCAKTKYFNLVYEIRKCDENNNINDISFYWNLLPIVRIQQLVSFDINYFSGNIYGEYLNKNTLNNNYYSEQIKQNLRINNEQNLFLISVFKNDSFFFKDNIKGYYLVRSDTKNEWNSSYNDGLTPIKNIYGNETGKIYGNEGFQTILGTNWYTGYVWNYANAPQPENEYYNPWIGSFLTIDTTDPNAIKFYADYQGLSDPHGNNDKSKRTDKSNPPKKLYEVIETNYGKNENINGAYLNNIPYFSDAEYDGTILTNLKAAKNRLNNNNNSTGPWEISGAINNGYPHLKGFYW